MKPTTKQNGAPPLTAKSDAPRDNTPYAVSLLERCASIPKLQTFNSAVGVAGLSRMLSGDGPITIFAPTDRAFSKMPPIERESLLADPERLAELIRHHVVSGRVKAPTVTKPRSVTPDFGDELKLTASPAGFQVGDARIVKTNIRATNGVIHAIDTVLDPR